ncbi:MAG TPA: lipoyl(octanoyl) transferase LipB [Polyangia bacterium]|jgi:lipoate-protein ligase B
MNAGEVSCDSRPAPPRDGAPASGVWRWLGRVPFAETAELQERLRAQVLGGGVETLLLLEHDPVITLGRSAVAANVLVDQDELARRHITLHQASRGGDVTYHGPGQLVGYPVVRLRGGVRAHVEAMAAAIAEVLGELGVQAHYRPTAPGLWVTGSAGEAKICAFGIHVRRRVVIHGFALNLAPALDAFGLIVPCGISGCAVTSVQASIGRAPTPQALGPRIAAALGARFGITFAPDDASPAGVSIAMRTAAPRMDGA